MRRLLWNDPSGVLQQPQTSKPLGVSSLQPRDACNGSMGHITPVRNDRKRRAADGPGLDTRVSRPRRLDPVWARRVGDGAMRGQRSARGVPCGRRRDDWPAVRAARRDRAQHAGIIATRFARTGDGGWPHLITRRPPSWHISTLQSYYRRDFQSEARAQWLLPGQREGHRGQNQAFVQAGVLA